ncbi:CAAX prenyl protease 1 homolog isoform X2 [Apium graveolens]|uniref:CAAX prenyl protease 1 homolog isoform X2 n=1 Tax=Apium graveolens TaxID=4045 RepID=UPI003D7AD7A7
MFTFVAVQFGGYTLVINSKDLFQSFGFDTRPVLIGTILFQHVVNFALNLVSRAFELQEDTFTKSLGYSTPLRAALVKLQVFSIDHLLDISQPICILPFCIANIITMLGVCY